MGTRSRVRDKVASVVTWTCCPLGGGAIEGVGPVGRPRDEESKHADDGSLQLLTAPAVLVAVVLVMMLTACAGASGDEDRASDDGGVSTAAAVDESGGGQILPPEMTEDGRMLQPEGHEGIWFETAPSDPLARLVYESQRFVGDPVELELLGDRALMPEWADMPYPCSEGVMQRMGDIGLVEGVSDSFGEGYGVAGCVVRGEQSASEFGEIPESFMWAFYDEAYSSEIEILEKGVRGRSYEVSTKGLVPEVVGCVAIMRSGEDLVDVGASYGENYPGEGCYESELSIQIVLNVLGWHDD